MSTLKHSKSFTIHFRDVDLKGHLKMSALVDFMQETSGEHSHMLGINYAGVDNEEQLYWVISRAKMHMDILPKHQETITIETYPAGIDKLFAVRRFDVYNAAHEQIGYIIGLYVLISAKSNMPVRIQTLGGKMKELNWPYEGEEKLDKLKAPTVIQMTDQRKVRSTEIDLNEHMNNAHYIRWVMDTFTTEELKHQSIQSIQTNYITALKENTIVHITRGLDPQGNSIIQGTTEDQKTIYWTSKVVLSEDVSKERKGFTSKSN